MSDKEAIELAIKALDIGMERAGRLTTGNLAHDKANLAGLLSNYRYMLKRHLQK